MKLVDIVLANVRPGNGEAVKVLKLYEAWEADVILNADWSDALPKLTQEQWDRLIEIQTARNAALKGATP